jgi:hypothetical protein
MTKRSLVNLTSPPDPPGAVELAHAPRSSCATRLRRQCQWAREQDPNEFHFAKAMRSFPCAHHLIVIFPNSHVLANIVKQAILAHSPHGVSALMSRFAPDLA